MKESYCGLSNTCELENPDFLEALAKVKEYVEQFPIYWWRHCFPEEEGFSLPEFIKGLEWFLSQPECPGRKQGGAFKRLPCPPLRLKKKDCKMFRMSGFGDLRAL